MLDSLVRIWQGNNFKSVCIFLFF